MIPDSDCGCPEMMGRVPTEGPTTAVEMVREFHEAFDLVIRHELQEAISDNEVRLRCKLISEEAREALAALRGSTHTTADVAQELADLIYVVYGTALHYGFDLDSVIAEVHRANMSKLDESGKPIYRDDGKVLKGPHYRPPNVAAVLGLK